MAKNKMRLIPVLFFLSIFLLSGSLSQGAETSSAIGNPAKADAGDSKNIPVFELPIPQSKSEMSYLGLSGTGNFRIGEIKAQVLIIEIFSFYCPHCQRSAAQINELYHMIQERPDIKEKIKMIGIGASNSAYEVDSFKERYHVPFPLFPDQNIEITQMLGVKGTPTFIGIKMKGKDGQERFYFGEGGFQDTQQFLDKIIRLSGLKEKEGGGK